PGKIDAKADDDETNWCVATASYGAGDLGTPGGANPACPIVVPTGKCNDRGTLRDIVPPAAGDLVLTEVMPNPTGTDTGREWFEVLVKKAVDLNGLELGAAYPTVLSTVDTTDCERVMPGTYLVFAHTDPSVATLLPHVDASFQFSLVNSDGGVFIGYRGALL